MGKDIAKNMSKIWSSKYSYNLFDYATQSATEAFNAASKKQFRTRQKKRVT